MRMLVIGPEGSAGVAVRQPMVNSLRFLGHQVLAVELPAGVARARQVVEAVLERCAPDVVITVPTIGGLPGSDMRELTAAAGAVAVAVHRGPTCPVMPTDLDQVGRDLMFYDLVTVPDRATFERWKAEGTFRLSMMRPAVHVPEFDVITPGSRQGVVVVGDADPANVDVVAAMESLGQVTVLGKGWDDLPLAVTALRVDDPVERAYFLAAAQLVVELPVSLAQQSAVRRHWRELGVSEAVLQAAVVGTPAVVVDRPGIGEHLRPGRDVVTCASPADIPSLVPLLLSTPDELALIGESAWRTVTGEHGWVRRWERLLGHWTDPSETDIDEDIRRVSAARRRHGSGPGMYESEGSVVDPRTPAILL